LKVESHNSDNDITGALIIALIGFLDSKRTQNEKDFEKLSQRPTKPVLDATHLSYDGNRATQGQLLTGAWI